MWNRRKDEPPPKPAATVPTPAELAREGIPMQTAPTKVSGPGSGAAAIGKSVVVKGDIYSREDLYVDGEVEGTIEVQEHRLTVGPNGRVKATVKAREAVIRGTVHGDIEATDRIDIRKDAKVVGDLQTTRIAVEEGAYFKGSVDVVRRPAPASEAREPQPGAAREAARPAGAVSSPASTPRP